MKLNHEQKIHEAACKDPGRYAMNHVRVRLDASTGKPQLEATDGRILAVVPVEAGDDGFEGGELLPVEFLKEAYKGRKTEDRDLRLVDDDGARRAQVVRSDAKGATTVEGTLGEGEFPKIDHVVPEERDDDILFTFDVDRLLRIAKATGADALTLRIPAAENRGLGEEPVPTSGDQVRGPVKVVVRSDAGAGFRRNGAYGVIMPVTLDTRDD